jgi:hypothetical protein
MKKYCFIIILFVLSVSVFGQQLLWTTVQGSDTRYVSISNVTKEVMNYYDQYDYYYDFTGFDKDTFIKLFGKDWDWVHSINNTTVTAVKVNIEGISIVYVICVKKNGVDMIAFTNDNDTGSIRMSADRKPHFENWFKEILLN